MVIIKKSALNSFGAKYPDAIQALNEWYSKVKSADWRNHAELKTTFLTAEYIANERYVVPERKGAMILYNNTLYWYLKVENI